MTGDALGNKYTTNRLLIDNNLIAFVSCPHEA
jgi:hypothetical protein